MGKDNEVIAHIYIVHILYLRQIAKQHYFLNIIVQYNDFKK